MLFFRLPRIRKVFSGKLAICVGSVYQQVRSGYGFKCLLIGDDNTYSVDSDPFGLERFDGTRVAAPYRQSFRPLIAEALARDIPVALGVSALNQKDFEEFSGGYSEEIAANAEGLAAWFRCFQRLPA